VFDPEALERGAKALREIDSSPNARKVLEVTKAQEEKATAEARAREAEFQAAAQQASVERERVHWDERRKTETLSSKQRAELAQYEDGLSRKRAEAEHELERQRNAEVVAMGEESEKRKAAERRREELAIQTERRATDKYRSDLEKENLRVKALAEAEGRIQEGRANEDVRRRELLLKAEEERKKAVEVASAWLSGLGKAGRELLSDRDKLAALVGGVAALALGVYSAREGTRVAGKALDRWMGTPSLVRETSRRRFGFGGGSGPGGAPAAPGGVLEALDSLVLPRELHSRVKQLAGSLSATKQRGAPFRHMMFHGPPGTGKTMAARILARQSGLDFAIMSGGDVAPLGGGAVTQIHDLFSWAERSKKGLVLLVDEADAFLTSRGGSEGGAGTGMSEGLRSSLNAMLHRTGDQSDSFLLILATNRPDDLDPAVLDRVDDALLFPLPDAEGRRSLLEMYLRKYVTEAHLQPGAGGGWFGGSSQPEVVRKYTEEELAKELDAAAKATEGFSARELAKMMASVGGAVYGTQDGALSAALLKEVVEYKVKEHGQKAKLGNH